MKTQTTFRDVNVRVHASKLKFALIFAFIFSVFQSQTYTFTGNGDGTSWTDAANWTGATGIPYIDDTTCSVNVGSFTVTIPSSTNLTMESGTVSGAGKIINNGNFTVETVGSKYFSIATFENNGDFIMGNTDVNAFVYLWNNHLFKNNSVGEIIANGIVFYNNGAHTVQNDGLFRKIGNFSENFNCVFVNNATIDVQAGTLIFSGNKEFNGGTYNVASGARLETTNSLGVLSGTLSGNIQGTFLLNGTNSVAASTTATNALAGTGILMESGTIQGGGKFINETIFTINTNAAKYFTIGLFQNKGTFNLGMGTNINNFVYLSNSTIFENSTQGVVNAQGITFYNNGAHTVRNFGTFKKLGDFEEDFNSFFTNEGTFQVDKGTLRLNGTNILRTGTFNVAEGAILDLGGSNTISGVWTGEVNGKLFLNGTNTVDENITITNQILGNGITMNSGYVSGAGTFLNKSIFTAGTNGSKYFTIANFENEGIFNLGEGSNLNAFIYFSNNTIFTNQLAGVLNIDGLAFYNNGAHSVVNKGLLKKIGNYEKTLSITLINEGTIQAEEGGLVLSGPNKQFKTGVFNVAQNSFINTIGGSAVLSGIWTGNVEGDFFLNGSLAVDGGSVTNSIGGNGITHTEGTISGTGTFINETIFTVDALNSKYLTISNFQNKGMYNLGKGTNLNANVYLSGNTIFENTSTGEIKVDGITFYNNGSHTIQNNGVFRKLGNFDETFNVNVTNTGNIVGEAGRIIFSGSLNNTTTGRISGFAIGTPAGNNFTNNGILAPGLSPGDLNVSGQLKLTNGILEIELNGNTPGTQYDQVSYNGTTAVSLSGNIHVSLGFAPAVGSQFVVVKSATAPITSTLAVTPYAEYEGNHYYFTVTNATNQVVLTVSNITLGTGQTEILKTKVYPNPVVGNLHYQSAEHLVGYELINTAGQNIRNGKLQGKTGEINMDNLKSGMYILILKYRDRTEHMKLIKK